MVEHRQRLSEEFRRLAFSCSEKDMSLKELAVQTESRAQALLTLILSVPFLFFIPLPGLSIIFGAFIMINGLRITAKKKLWFPSLLLRKRISSYALKKAFLIAERWAIRIERFVRPRGEIFHRHPFFERINGIMLMCCGFFLALPLPPGTNFLPGLTTFLLSLGILEEDGYCLLVAHFIFTLVLGFYIALPIVGIEALTGTSP